MPKLRKLDQDILDLLKQNEPSMLLWREIINILWPKYEDRYPKSGKKGFGVAISNKLGKLNGKLIKHEKDYWGTLNSSPPCEPITLWHRLIEEFEKVGGYLVDITVKKASDDGVDPITGWFKFKHDTEYSAKVIIILRNAPELVDLANSFKIYLRDEYEGKEFAGVVLTQDSISYMDLFSWKNELYKIWDTKDVMDGYDFSYRIGYLTWLPK